MGIGPSVRIEDTPNSTAVDPATVVKENPDLFKPDGYAVARVLEEVKAKDPSLFGDGSENLASLTEYLNAQDGADGKQDGMVAGSATTANTKPTTTDLFGPDYTGTAGSASADTIVAADQALRDQGYVFVGYHGSSAQGSESILTHGISNPNTRQSVDPWSGFYLADDPTTAAGYALDPQTGDPAGSQLVRVYLPKELAEKLQNLGTPLDQESQALLEFKNATGIEAGTPGAEYLMRGLEKTGEEGAETIMSWSLAEKAVAIPSSIKTPQTFREQTRPLEIPEWEAGDRGVYGRPPSNTAFEAAKKGEALSQPAPEGTNTTSAEAERAAEIFEQTAKEAVAAAANSPGPAEMAHLVDVAQQGELLASHLESNGLDASQFRKNVMDPMYEQLSALGVTHGESVTTEAVEEFTAMAEHDTELAGLLNGSIQRAFRVGGKVMLVVGASHDAYRIITADDKALEAAKVAGGWTGALVASANVEKLLVPAFANAGPFGWAAALLVGLAAGAVGYYLGSTAGGAAYAWTEETWNLDTAVTELSSEGETEIASYEEAMAALDGPLVIGIDLEYGGAVPDGI